MVNTTLIQDLNKIANMIYTVSYDQLPDYLKGVRDMINLINQEEKPTEHIVGEITKTVQEIYGHVEIAK